MGRRRDLSGGRGGGDAAPRRRIDRPADLKFFQRLVDLGDGQAREMGKPRDGGVAVDA